jgi:hypothetical protein
MDPLWNRLSPGAKRAVMVDHLALQIRKRQDRHRSGNASPVRRAANRVAHSSSRRTNRQFLRAVAHGGPGVTPDDRRSARKLLRSYRRRHSRRS